MATPKGDNSKGQRKTAAPKKADPGSRGRKTSVLKGPANARVTPKLVESGVASPAKLVTALVVKVGTKKAIQMISKSKSGKSKAAQGKTKSGSERSTSNNSAVAKATGKDSKLSDYATGKSVKNPTSNTRFTAGEGKASAIPKSQKNAAVLRAYSREGRHPETGRKLKYPGAK